MLAITTFNSLALFVAISLHALQVSCEDGHRSKFHTMPILPRSLASEQGTGVTLQKRCQAQNANFGNGMQKRFVPMKVSLLSCNDDGSGTKCKYGTKILDGQAIFEPLLHQANALLMPTKHAKHLQHDDEDESNGDQDDDDDKTDDDDQQDSLNTM